nr:unnamed protein product [Callosobruchus analis]
MHWKAAMTEHYCCVEDFISRSVSYLASGCMFTDLHYSYRVGISTARVIEMFVKHCGRLCKPSAYRSLQRIFGNR